MSQDQSELPPEQVREIPKWTRAYSSNRTLPMLVVMAVSAVLFIASYGFFSRAGNAYRGGRQAEFGVCLAAACLCLAVITSQAIPRVSRRTNETLSRCLYGDIVAPPSSTSKKPPRWAPVVPVAFGICVLATAHFGSHIPKGYEQPVTALYVIPFLLLTARGAGIARPLCALLYGLHAVLILSGVPITFHGKWSELNLWLPVFGYGMLSLLVGHFYSRVALRRLRRLA